MTKGVDSFIVYNVIDSITISIMTDG